MEEIKRKTVTLLGATGLIGSHLLDLLVQDETIEKIYVPLRREMNFSHKKIESTVIDFANKKALCQMISPSDAVFCAVGTTIKKVGGDLELYRKIDFDIPLNAARCCLETACPHFLLVSSVGADSQSKNFYLKLKGETENALIALDLPALSIFRPSMLLGKRAEFRFGESVGQALMPLFSFLIPSKYRPIQARTVAQAMIQYSKKNLYGAHFYHFSEMINLDLPE